MAGSSMGQRRRFAFSTGQKIILWIGALLCLWQLIQIPAVFDTILNFYAAGAVPGTDIVLAPDTVLKFLLAFFVSCMFVVLYVQFGRRPRSKPAVYPPVPLAEAGSVKLSRPQQRLWAGLAARLPSAVAKGYTLFARWATIGLRYAHNAWVKVQPRLVIAGRAMARVAGWLGNGVVAVIIWILAVESAVAIWMWQTTEPHLRRFDRWLERKVNAHPYGARLVAVVRTVSSRAMAARQRAAARSAKRPDVLSE